MNHHKGHEAEAGRLARRAAVLRRTEREAARMGKASAAVECAREASRLEQRALQLVGWQPVRVAS